MVEGLQFNSLADVPAVEEPSEIAHALIEDGGVIKRAPISTVGGGNSEPAMYYVSLTDDSSYASRNAIAPMEAPDSSGSDRVPYAELKEAILTGSLLLTDGTSYLRPTVFAFEDSQYAIGIRTFMFMGDDTSGTKQYLLYGAEHPAIQ